MNMTRTTLAVAGLCAIIGVGGLRAQQTPPPAPPAGGHAGHDHAAPAAAGKTATAKLNPTKDSTARGEVTFTQEAKGVRVVGSFNGLQMGEHGFHIHEKGDCSAPDGASAGGHFNPTSKPHAARETADRHAGDLGNVKADPYSMGRVDFVDEHISLDGPNSIIGKAVILHAQKDDFTTQPTGNAGARLACGVIEAGGK